MKSIPLTQGKVTLVDDADYPELSKYRWSAHKKGNVYYADRHSPRAPQKPYKQKTILMHIVIMGTPNGLETDHINGDGLDNRKENLRIVTKRQNAQNRHIPKSSKFPGVSWNNWHRKWGASIRVNGRLYHLGYYGNERTASRRYRIACDWQAIEL